jgi:hypothetical protein
MNKPIRTDLEPIFNHIPKSKIFLIHKAYHRGAGKYDYWNCGYTDDEELAKKISSYPDYDYDEVTKIDDFEVKRTEWTWIGDECIKSTIIE